jgi:hypothetical protein
MASGLTTLAGQIRNPRSRVFRKLEIKRRLRGTGVYEDTWQDVTEDVIKWGTVKKEIDSVRINQFKFSNVTLIMNNQEGLFNADSDENSLWYGYGSQQRTLVRIKAGFLLQEKDASGVWTNTEIPSAEEEQIIFSGYISGNITIGTNNQANIPVVPLTEAFRQFSASRISGYSDSLTASEFIENLRDQQDVLGSYIFRPFFGNTTTNWVISTTTIEYANLNTNTNEDILNRTVWDVVQQLAEAEAYVPFISSDGKLYFTPRDVNTTPVFEFYGPGYYSPEYLRTIKKINSYGQAFSKYYSRVSVKWRPEDTATSYEVRDSQYLVRGDSGPWTLGERTLQVENTWIPTATVAENIAESLFQEFSAIKFEISFTTSFVPQIEVFDRVLISYDQSQITNNSLWDVYSWGDTTVAIDPDDLLWDDSPGSSIKLQYDEFQIISVQINLDSLECTYIGRR